MSKTIIGVKESLESLHWYTSLTYHDHGNIAMDPSTQSELFILGRAIEPILQWCDENDKHSRTEIRILADQFFDDHRYLSDMLAEIVEAWCDENDKLCIDPCFVSAEMLGFENLCLIDRIKRLAMRLKYRIESLCAAPRRQLASPPSLLPRQLQILEECQDGVRLNACDIAVKVDISETTAQNDCRFLEEIGLLHRPNGPRSGYTATEKSRNAVV